jgi:NAD+ kinase
MHFGIIGNTEKENLVTVVHDLVAHLKALGVDCVVEERIARAMQRQYGTTISNRCRSLPLEELLGKSETLIAFGGDGTMLAAARMLGKRDIPILGVNLGKLGFLAEVGVDELYPFVDAILEGHYRIEHRMVLKAVVEKQEYEELYGLNDVVLERSGTTRVINIETYVNEEYLITYMADGLIISTPTGSTAYSLAAGGPIVTPQSKVIAISPICPHTLTARPIVVPDDSTIKVLISERNRKVLITADGQVQHQIEAPVEFAIGKADYSIQLVKWEDRSYYDLLRTKLMWGKDVRANITE